MISVYADKCIGTCTYIHMYAFHKDDAYVVSSPPKLHAQEAATAYLPYSRFRFLPFSAPLAAGAAPALAAAPPSRTLTTSPSARSCTL